LNTFNGLRVERCCLARQFCEEADLLLVRDLFLKENFLRLGQHDGDEGLDRLSAQVGRGRM